MIRVVLVDDQELVREGLRRILHPDDGFEIVAECADGSEVVDAVAAAHPDVVVMDVRMRDVSGIEATRRLRARGDVPPVIVLTTFDTDEHLVGALQAGAAGFLLKGARPEELLSGIRSIAGGEAVLAPSATRRLLQQFAPVVRPEPSDDRRLDALTDREREVLAAVCTGATNPEIATTLHMAERTVKTHIGRLLHKTHSRDRVGLVLFAHEVGLL